MSEELVLASSYFVQAVPNFIEIIGAKDKIVVY